MQGDKISEESVGFLRCFGVFNPKNNLLTYVRFYIILLNELLWISVTLSRLFGIPDYMGFGC